MGIIMGITNIMIIMMKDAITMEIFIIIYIVVTHTHLTITATITTVSEETTEETVDLVEIADKLILVCRYETRLNQNVYQR